MVGWVDWFYAGVYQEQNPTGAGLINSFTATPSRVHPPGNTTLRWDVTGMAACGVTGSDGSTPAASSAENGIDGAHQASAAVTKSTIYTLSCTDASSFSYSATVSVGTVPVIQEI